MIDPLLQKLINRRELRKSSQAEIIRRFKQYEEITGLTPTMAIDEADEDEENGVRLRRRRIVQHLDDFEIYLHANYKPSTIKNYISTIRSFYIENYIELPPPTKHKPPEPITITTDDLPNREDIKLAVENVKSRNKAIFILNATSGMGRCEIIPLTMSDFINAVNKHNTIDLTLENINTIHLERPEIDYTQIKPLEWNIKRFKTGREYTTFSTPESLEHIFKYLHIWMKNRSVTLESPLFFTKTGNRLSIRAFSEIYAKINHDMNFGLDKQGKSFFRSHNLRKWFANQLKTVVGYDNAQLLLGHKVKDPVRGAYLKPDISYLYNSYYENLNLLNITKDVDVVMIDKTEELNDEIQGLKEQIELIKRQQEVKEMENNKG